jgi:hypothetical protein
MTMKAKKNSGKTSKRGRSSTKRMKGKGTISKSPVYKPTLYLDDGNIPTSIRKAKPGSRVSMTVEGKISRRSEEAGGTTRVDVEIGRIKS